MHPGSLLVLARHEIYEHRRKPLPDFEKSAAWKRTAFYLKWVVNPCRPLLLLFPGPMRLMLRLDLWFHTNKLLCCGQHMFANVLQNPGEVHATSSSDSRAELSQREDSMMVAADAGCVR